MKRLPFSIALAILIAFHFFGIVGMTSEEFYDITLKLTPLNLLVTFGVLTWSQSNQRRQYILMAMFVIISSFFLEMVGVNTGYPFGEYSYGDPLGVKWKGTPLLIGINWWVVTFGAALLVRRVSNSAIVNALVAALVVVAFDYIMEPVAIRLGFWTWEMGDPPLENYLTWGAAIFIYSLLIYRYLNTTINKIASYVFIIQAVFFAILLLLGRGI